MPTPDTDSHQRQSLFSLDPSALERELTSMGQPRFRVGQILRWAYERGASDFNGMTDLSLPLRDTLAGVFHLYESEIAQESRSTDGTIKLLLRWQDRATTECVMIPDGERRTACISTQVGCPVRCVFCASGVGGLERNLHAGQIVEQAMRVRQLCGDNRLSNIVFMGLGEPLHNYDATLAAVRAINADWGMNIAARKITISTVGLPKQIERLAEESLQVTLAISLHAPTDELRKQIIPWAESITIDSLVQAAKTYFTKTGREVTLEYILLGGLNDGPQHARQLVTIARRMRGTVNLIRYNPVEGLPYQRPTSEAVTRFQAILRERGLNSHIRKSRGLDIEGACGQLRRRHQTENQ